MASISLSYILYKQFLAKQELLVKGTVQKERNLLSYKDEEMSCFLGR